MTLVVKREEQQRAVVGQRMVRLLQLKPVWVEQWLLEGAVVGSLSIRPVHWLEAEALLLVAGLPRRQMPQLLDQIKFQCH